MSYRSLAFVVAAFSSMHVASADAQSVYVAPGGVYVANGPVYVTPAPNIGPGPYVAPSNGYGYGPYVAPGNGYGYGPPALVEPGPAVVAPTVVYGPNGGYYDPPLSAYAAELAPRPPLPVPYGRARCAGPYGYGACY
jgi:hypothetical protein